MKFMRAEIKGTVAKLQRMTKRMDGDYQLKGLKDEIDIVINDLHGILDDEKTRRHAKIEEDLLEVKAESDRMNQEIVVER